MDVFKPGLRVNKVVNPELSSLKRTKDKCEMRLSEIFLLHLQVFAFEDIDQSIQ